MLDVSSGIRFHPAEIMVSLLIKIIIVVLAGVPVTVVILFEIVLNLTSLFNHSNLALPLWLDRVLRLFVVTPDMHRIHHSLEGEEQQRNYGFNLTWWDYIFSSYKPYPNQSQTEMVLGVHGFCERKESSFKGLMRQPLD